MPGKVKLSVIEGPMKGAEFAFAEHDTFLFGRQEDCHAHLPNDEWISRHHFILEANPPDARVRDLGSLNGTYVNGKKYGGRAKTETPEEAAKRLYPEVDLKDDDRIKVGATTLQVRVEAPVYCARCGAEIAFEDREKSALNNGVHLCTPCRKTDALERIPPKPPEPVRCAKCGQDATKEVGANRRGEYVCESCRNAAEGEPAELLKQLLREFLGQHAAQDAPSITGYDMGKRIGVGGFGAVYAARRKSDGQPVAIKVMLSKTAVDERSRAQFAREIDVMKELCSDYIVPIYDHGSVASAFYFAMELCSHGVVDFMARSGGKLTMRDAAPIMRDALKGLIDAHKRSIIHRDLKPPNLLVKVDTARTVTKIADFGLAKNFSKAGFSGMTVTGSAAGSAGYMPREQITDYKYVKPASDIFSMGATFYNLLTGMVPRDFRGDKHPMEIVLQSPVVPIRKRDSGIPKGIAAVIDRACDDEPGRRFASASEMLTTLEAEL